MKSARGVLCKYKKAYLSNVKVTVLCFFFYLSLFTDAKNVYEVSDVRLNVEATVRTTQSAISVKLRRVFRGEQCQV